MGLYISDAVRSKLDTKHGVSEEEIIECFCNKERTHKFLTDTREDHKTDPPTKWFIASTDFGRLLKVVFIQCADGTISIKSAFPPNDIEIRIYNNHGT